jgi:hypothetical protein
MDFPDEVKKTLTEVLAKYAAGNAEIVQVYFSRPRSREQDITWLKCQAARELTTAWKFLDNLKELQPKFEKNVKRRDYENLARAFSEELEHYRLFAAILEEEFGEKIDVDELLTLGVWSDNDRFTENTKKARYEKELRASGDEMAKIALGIGEGGGSGWLIGLSRITGGKLEQRMDSYRRCRSPDQNPRAARKSEKHLGRILTVSFTDEKRTIRPSSCQGASRRNRSRQGSAFGGR